MTEFIPPAKPLIGDEERAAVDRVLRSGMLAQGPEVKAFEEEFSEHFGLGRACVAVNSGTSGQHLGLLSSGVKAGRRGHRPVVHLRGHRELRRAHRRHAGLRRHRRRRLLPLARGGRGGDHRPDRRHHAGPPVRPPGEDGPPHGHRRRGTASTSSRTPRRRTARRSAAHPVGAFGTFAMFSLYPTKNMTSGEGGMVSVADAEIERNMRLYRNQGMEKQYHNEVVGLNNRMTDIHAAIGRVQLKKVDGWTATRQDNAAFLDAHLEGVVVPPVAAGCRARLPPVHDPSCRRTATASPQRCARSTTSARAMFYPVPNHRLAAVPGRRRPAGDRARGQRVPVAAGPPLAVARTSSASSRRSTPSRRQVPDWRTCVPASSVWDMGRHHARVLGNLPGVDFVAVADPGGDVHGVSGGRPVEQDIEALIAPRARLLHGRGADDLPRADRARARGGGRPHDDREAARPGHRRPRSGWPRLREQRPRRRRRSHRALQPRSPAGAGPDRGGRPRRDLPGRHPTAGPIPGPHRRRRGGQGPRHPRHRPDRVGDPAGVHAPSPHARPTARAASTRTWSRSSGSSPRARSRTTS